jgi:hypothetical protein
MPCRKLSREAGVLGGVGGGRCFSLALGVGPAGAGEDSPNLRTLLSTISRPVLKSRI